MGVALAAGLADWRRSGRGGYQPFLHHVTRAGRSDPADLAAGASVGCQ